MDGSFFAVSAITRMRACACARVRARCQHEENPSTSFHPSKSEKIALTNKGKIGPVALGDPYITLPASLPSARSSEKRIVPGVNNFFAKYLILLVELGNRSPDHSAGCPTARPCDAKLPGCDAKGSASCARLGVAEEKNSRGARQTSAKKVAGPW